ncbi:Hypothetical predicted protein [Pelobates cultripes]|uniref:Uncharacterized protein n=1 Tax=Pelobates cultripes TaxID=61616 RepID=A0AAD1SG76_PELCU|nr:Hypothetical predicted protein [Pelobates cultripes]
MELLRRTRIPQRPLSQLTSKAFVDSKKADSEGAYCPAFCTYWRLTGNGGHDERPPRRALIKHPGNIGQFQEEIGGAEARLTSLENKLQALQRERALATDRMTVMEDKRRWKTVNMHSLADDMEAAEIPHFFRRLLVSLFSSKQAKVMRLDGCYKIPASPKTTVGSSRDVIIHF